MVWGGTEIHFSIVCASAPALKAFISNVKAGMTRAASMSKDSKDDSKMTPAFGRFPSNTHSVLDEEVVIGRRILVTETVTMSSIDLEHRGGSPPYPMDDKPTGALSMPSHTIQAKSTTEVTPTSDLQPWRMSTKSLKRIETSEKPPSDRAKESSSSDTPSYASTDPLHPTTSRYSPRARASSESVSSISSSHGAQPGREKLTIAEILKAEH
jgi:hypothetical protein